MSSKFQDFEHSPADQVWRRIQIEVEGDARPGSLAGQLGEFSFMPRPHVWDAIATATRPPMRRRAVVFWWAATAASVALLLLVGLKYGREGREENTKEANTWSAQIRTDSAEKAFSGSQAFENGAEGHVAFARGAGHPPTRSLQDQGLSPLLFASADDDQPRDETGPDRENSWRIPRDYLLASDTFPGSRQENRYKFARRHTPNPGENGNWDELPPLPDRDRALYAATFNSGLTPAQGASFFASGKAEDWHYNQNGLDPALGFADGDAAFGPVAGENFQTPLVIGLQMRRNLTRRFSLGAGPVYTLMTSTGENTQAGILYRERTRRQYLGASLTANYEFLQRRRFSAYLSAGTRLDFGLDRRHRVVTSQEGRQLADETNTYGLGNQALLTGGMGVDYHLTDYLGVYLQGSIMHAYYRTEPNLWTVYRFWPGLQVGLRLNI